MIEESVTSGFLIETGILVINNSDTIEPASEFVTTAGLLSTGAFEIIVATLQFAFVVEITSFDFAIIGWFGTNGVPQELD